MGTVIPPWKQLLLNALQSNSHLRHSSYFQLATIGSNGRPANRTVVYRLQYLGPNPGLPSLGDQPTEVPSSLDPSAGPVAAYCLLVLDPDQVDYLNLKSNERMTFSRMNANEENSWTSDRVNP
ncbi:FMN-binding split barrel [Cynara cardunculus var. scolymus]|uniref:pyridoxal 5'-phosphate synthase n=1 Tax=Cynara cardunculus var. scolymus TaxID=59895 RepID=A0A103XUW1_CYNCS|nr:FMN-binding split barrel [Cynara cardunculus var. scolymus]